MNSHDTHTDHIDTDYIHPKLRDLVHSVGLVGWTRIIVGNWAILGAIILGLFIHLKSVANFDQAVLNWVLTIRIDALTAFMKAVTHLFSPTVSVIEAVVLGLLIWAVSKSWRFGLFIPLVMAVSAVATSLVKLGIERVRPPIPERLVVELSHSFPLRSHHRCLRPRCQCCSACVTRMGTIPDQCWYRRLPPFMESTRPCLPDLGARDLISGACGHNTHLPGRALDNRHHWWRADGIRYRADLGRSFIDPPQRSHTLDSEPCDDHMRSRKGGYRSLSVSIDCVFVWCGG